MSIEHLKKEAEEMDKVFRENHFDSKTGKEKEFYSEEAEHLYQFQLGYLRGLNKAIVLVNKEN